MAKGNKYGVANKEDRTWYGTVYDSKLEMKYAQHLEMMRKASKDSDKVIDVMEQVKYPIYINDKLIFNYKLDFRVHYADGGTEFVDVKGMKTAIYRLKKKAVEAYYNIKIKEVFKGEF